MNRYEPATPRTALGAIAFALTIVTFGLFVAAPAALVAHGTYGQSGATIKSAVAAGIAMDSVRILPSVDVVASRRLES
jgi:hypothetical protein